MDIQQRLAEFFNRLNAARPATTSDEALGLVCRLIEAVEDELCPLPRQNPPPLVSAGRMYAPQEDHVRRFADGLIIADTRHHRIYCRANGGISIVHLPTESTVLYKKGRDERAS